MTKVLFVWVCRGYLALDFFICFGGTLRGEERTEPFEEKRIFDVHACMHGAAERTEHEVNALHAWCCRAYTHNKSEVSTL